MNIILFGGGYKGSVVLSRLIEDKQNVSRIVTFEPDQHEVIWYNPIRDIASPLNIPVIDYKQVGLTDIIKEHAPDVIFVSGWRYKIPQEQYCIPYKGTIVFHDSLLPKYRGFAPMNWAIINGEKEMGVTMFYIAEDIDSGDIIGQRKLKINDYEDAKAVEKRVAVYYRMLISDYLPLIEKGTVKCKPQNHSLATYTCKRLPDDGLIDWTKPTKDIYNLIRGLAHPYPGAFTYVNGYKLTVLSSGIPPQREYAGRICGRVVTIVKGMGVEVLTGDGSIVIEKVNYNGYNTTADKIISSIRTTMGV